MKIKFIDTDTQEIEIEYSIFDEENVELIKGLCSKLEILEYLDNKNMERSGDD